MIRSGSHPAHDRLLAEMQLIEKRLAGLGDRLESVPEQVLVEVSELHVELSGRCAELAEEVRSWVEVEVGVPSGVADLASDVDALESDIEALTSSERADYELLMDRQVRAWRGRIDRLRLQGALGAMEARDDVDALSQRLDRVRGDVLVELQAAAGSAGDLVTDLRDDVEAVLSDIRRAVRKATKDLTERSDGPSS
ncbi:MAG: hypothetical protein GY925_08150 [Actinomycetia bacterium]|nr:hypothetical protein [Actinomycetes bacterium]